MFYAIDSIDRWEEKNIQYKVIPRRWMMMMMMMVQIWMHRSIGIWWLCMAVILIRMMLMMCVMCTYRWRTLRRIPCKISLSHKRIKAINRSKTQCSSWEENKTQDPKTIAGRTWLAWYDWAGRRRRWWRTVRLVTDMDNVMAVVVVVVVSHRVP